MAENKASANTSQRLVWRWIVAILGGLLLAVSIASVRWLTLPEPRHFWPLYADDWSAWGTCVGAVGTILAVVYAARTLKSSSEAQLKEQRDRRLEMDFLEAKEADEAIKLRPDIKGFPRTSDEWGDSADITGARIFVQNFSDSPFRDVQVFFLDEILGDGVNLRNIEYWDTTLVPVEDRGLRPGAWKKMEAPGGPVPGHNLFLLGTVLPKQCLSVTFDFTKPIMGWDWSVVSMNASDGFARDFLVSVTFLDHNNKTWQRTSRDGGEIRRIRFPSEEPSPA